MAGKTPEIPRDWTLKMGFKLIGGGHLHLGLWNPGEAHTLGNLRKSMARFSERVFAYIPPGVNRILDAGCGTGKNARLLEEKGYSVECLSPEAYHLREHKRHAGGGRVKFTVSRFEDFESPGKYDLVLMLESFGYMDAGVCLRKSFGLLKERGFLLIANPLTQAQERAIVKAGFELLREEDVSARINPSFQVMRAAFKQYWDPYSRFLWEMLRSVEPELCGRLVKSCRRVWDHNTQRLAFGRGSEIFKTDYALGPGLKYKICLFRKKR